MRRKIMSSSARPTRNARSVPDPTHRSEAPEADTIGLDGPAPPGGALPASASTAVSSVSDGSAVVIDVGLNPGAASVVSGLTTTGGGAPDDGAAEKQARALGTVREDRPPPAATEKGTVIGAVHVPGIGSGPAAAGGPAEKEKSRAETENIQRGAHPVPDEGLQFEPGPDIRRLGLGVGAFRMADAGGAAEAEDESLSEPSGSSSVLCGYMSQPTSAQIVEAEQRRRAEAIVKAASASSVDAAAVSPVNESKRSWCCLRRNRS